MAGIFNPSGNYAIFFALSFYQKLINNFWRGDFFVAETMCGAYVTQPLTFCFYQLTAAFFLSVSHAKNHSNVNTILEHILVEFRAHKLSLVLEYPAKTMCQTATAIV